MKISVARGDLEKALHIASIGLDPSSPNINGHFVFRAKDNEGAEVLSYNGRLGSSVPLICSAEIDGDEGMFTAEGWRLKQWISAAGDVAIDLTEKESKIVAKTQNARGTFRSLDSSDFAFWDRVLESSKVVAEVSPSRLRDALNLAKNFIHNKDTQSPEFAVCQSSNGVIKSSDRVALAVSVIKGLENCSFRIHHKDIPSVISYLQTCDDDEGTVELLEHDHALFIRRVGGQVLSVGRPNIELPNIGYDIGDRDPFQLTVASDEVKTAIKQLSACAEKNDVTLRIKFDRRRKSIILSMRSAEGGEDTVRVECSSVEEDKDHLRETLKGVAEVASKGKVKNLGKEESKKMIEEQTNTLVDKAVKTVESDGFPINYTHLSRVVGIYSSEKMQFGVNPRGRGGYVRFKETREDDTFLVMLAFIRDLTKRNTQD